MKKLLLSICLASFVLLGTNSYAQFSFEDQNSILSTTNVQSGAPVVVMDMNGDRLDDIVRMDGHNSVLVEFQQPDGTFTSINHGALGSSSWAVCAADVDEDGIREIYTGGAYNQVKVLKMNAGGTAYIQSNLPDASIFVQATAFADPDGDGDVDFFACHDDGPSVIWVNDGSGNMTINSTQVNIDLATTMPSSDGSGNYGSIWTDYDNDGDVDLYIAKCRQGVTSFTDARRINQLYINDGNNNYTQDFGDAAGLRIGAQSWTADFGDYDNDGDFDCFITNHDVESQFLRNDNGVFVDVTTAAGIDVDGTPIQAKMEDFDNDGFVDLLVSGSNEALFLNDGDGTFTEWSGSLDNNEDLHSFALGDLNHDGKVDIYAGYGGGFNSSGSQDDGLLINTIDNGNNYYNINLEGTVSNRDALGAKVRIYGAWGMQTREVRAGESYGIAHTLTCHFGLGSATTIDSVTIAWPSGLDQVIVNPGINQTAHVIENTCVSPDASIVNPSGTLILCGGNTIDLEAPSGFGFIYEWANGQTTQQITASTAGVYSVEVSDGSACSSIATAVVLDGPDETPDVAVMGDTKFCEGGSVTLMSSSATDYMWSTSASDTDQSLEVTETGVYTVTITGTCANFTSEAVIVEVLAAPSSPTAMDMLSTTAGTITLTATGTNPVWYDSPTSNTPIGTGSTFETPNTTESTTYTYYVEDKTDYPGNLYSGGIEEHIGTSEYAGGAANQYIGFDVFENSTLRTVTVYTDTPGPREIEIRNSAGTVIASAPVNLAVGENTVTLDFDLVVGTGYRLTTNEAVNQTNLGLDNPRLQRTNGVNGGGVVDFPYDINGIVELNESPFSDYYYYFYDWKVEEATLECVSNRTEVKAEFAIELDTVGTGIINIQNSLNAKVYPNPTSGSLSIEISDNANQDLVVNLFNTVGKRVIAEITENAQAVNIDISNLASGIYMIEVKAGDKVYRERILKN